MTSARPRNRTVVVVDENAEYREILIDLLARLPGVRLVASGANGADAVALCARHRPNFLLLDSGMKEFGALHAAAAVRATAPETCIVFLTTGSVWLLRAAADVALADHIVSKSDVKSELLAMLTGEGGGDGAGGI